VLWRAARERPALGGIGGTAVASSAATAAAPSRLPYLDGLRGLSALYVLIFHSLDIRVPQDGERLSLPLRGVDAVFNYGHMAVCMFIVLSGFSLMLPLARRGTWQLQGGFGGFMRRRGRRVLPPYYAALLLSLLVIIGYRAVSAEAEYEEALSPASIASHVFLVHNWSFDWVYRINGPMWSVATEWQIYVLMPLVLIPLWRRLGAAVTLALTWGSSVAIYFGVPADNNLYWAAPWFVGSFALGMWGAEVSFADQPWPGRLRRLPWSRVSLASFALLVAVLAGGGDAWAYVWTDGLVSIFAATLIVALVAQAHETPEGRRTTRFCSARPIAFLGGFSYSMYLLQHPLLKLTEKAFGSMPVSYDVVVTVQLLVGTPFILFVSWVFAEFLERPFTGGGLLLPYLRRRLGGPVPVIPT
jgi:peptidoglycan/LPS O-acetylase OafA/YrhL